MTRYMRIFLTVLTSKLCQSTVLLRQQGILRSTASDLLVHPDADIDTMGASLERALAASSSPSTLRNSEVILNVTFRSGNSSKTIPVEVDSHDDAQRGLLEAMVHVVVDGAQDAESKPVGSSRSSGSLEESQAQEGKEEEDKAASLRGAAAPASSSIDVVNTSIGIPLVVPASSEGALVASSSGKNPFKHFADKLSNKVKHAMKSAKHMTHTVSKVVSGMVSDPLGKDGIVGRLVENAVAGLAARIASIPGFDKDMLNIEALDSPLAEAAINGFITDIWGPSALTPTEIREFVDGASKVIDAMPGVINAVNHSLDDASFSDAVAEVSIRMLLDPTVQAALSSPAVKRAVYDLPRTISIMKQALSNPIVHEAITSLTSAMLHVMKTIEEIRAIAAVVDGVQDKLQAASLHGEAVLDVPPRVEAPRKQALIPSSNVNRQKLFADELAKKVLQAMKSAKHMTHTISRVVSDFTSDPSGQDSPSQGLVENAIVKLASGIARIPGFGIDLPNIDTLSSQLTDLAIDEFISAVLGPSPANSSSQPPQIDEVIEATTKIIAAVPGVIDAVNKSLDDNSFQASVSEAVTRMLFDPSVQAALQSPAVRKTVDYLTMDLPDIIQSIQQTLDIPWVRQAVDTVISAIPTIVNVVSDTVIPNIQTIAKVVIGAQEAIKSINQTLSTEDAQTSIVAVASQIPRVIQIVNESIHAGTVEKAVDIAASGLEEVVANLMNTLQSPASERTIAAIISAVLDIPGVKDLLKNEKFGPIIEFLSSLPGFLVDVVEQLAILREDPKDGGATASELNEFLFWLIIVGLAVLGGAGVLDCIHYKRVTASGRPRLWVAAMVTYSYALLIPGLFGMLFSFIIGVKIFGLNVILTYPRSSWSIRNTGPITESVISLLDLLWDSDGYVAVFLIVFYAIVVPLIKLGFLVVGEWWRFSPSRDRRKVARICIRSVQIMSKWACPDMFAYIFLIVCFRDLTQGSDFVLSKSHVDKGFACFTIFCLLSTISSLAISCPELEEESQETVAERKKSLKISASGLTRLRLVSLVLAVGMILTFTVLFICGIGQTALTLHFNANLLVEPTGPLPRVALPLIEATGILRQLSAHTSTVSVVESLWNYGTKDEANCMLAYILLTGFALALPALDMFLLLVAGISFSFSRFEVAENTMRICRVVGKLSMLDVLLLGIIVVNAAIVAYKKYGIETSLGSGFVALVCAEFVHYLTFFMMDTLTVAIELDEDEKKLEQQTLWTTLIT